MLFRSNAIIKRRVLEEANIIVNTETTLRNLARRLGISKSTIHKDMQIRLIKIDQNLYHKVQKVFKKHLEIRYYIGGEKTRQKYKNII